MNAQIDHVLSIENRLVFRVYLEGDREFWKLELIWHRVCGADEL